LTDWAAAGFKDTLLRWKMKPEVVMGTRRQFSREFKLEAVRLVKDRGVSVAQAARDLDVHENVLRKWVREAMADPQEAFPARA
jgi:transposase